MEREKDFVSDSFPFPAKLLWLSFFHSFVIDLHFIFLGFA